MEIQSVLFFQIFADVVLCVAVFYLLFRIGRKINKSDLAALDGQYLSEFRTLLEKSQNDAELFFTKLDESLLRLKELAAGIEEKEKRLKALSEETQDQYKNTGRICGNDDILSDQLRQKRIMKFIDEGISIEDIAMRLGSTAGEIKLIVDIEKKKKEVSK